MSNEIHIASFVVFIQPILFEQVVDHLAQQNMECPLADAEHSKCIVVMEEPSTQALEQRVAQIREISGVISVTLVYHHTDNHQNLEQELA